MLRRRLLLGAAVSAAAVASGCAPKTPPLDPASSAPSGPEIVVGSASFTESRVLAQLYAQAMRAAGVNARPQLDVGDRAACLAAISAGRLQLLPEYSGQLLLHFDPNNPAETEDQIEQALPGVIGPELTMLPASQASDADVFVVTRRFAQAESLNSLDGLEQVSSSAVLAGPAELANRADGVPGLLGVYQARFKEFRPVESPTQRIAELLADNVQVASFRATDAALDGADIVRLSDPQSMILPQHIIALARSEVAGMADATGAVSGVQLQLSTRDLTILNKQVEAEKRPIAEVTAAWLRAKGLA